MKRIYGLILCLLWCVLLSGCTKEKGTEMQIYCVNSEGNTLVQQEYFRKETDLEKSVQEIIDAMLQPVDDKEFQSAIPKTVEIEKFRISDNKLEFTFNSKYLELPKGTEVLLRAAVVHTFVQLPEVQFVSFYIGEEPLKDSSGNAIGLMRAEDFVQNTGAALKSIQVTDLKLFFSDKQGTMLSLEKRTDVHYNTNTSVEKLVVEQLMKGPSSDKRSATIPNTVKLLGVSLKDGTCYVNFDSAFLTDGYNQKPEVTIYSIVNSIVANGNATKVQILVDGSSDVTFMGAIDLRGPLEWKADLVEE